ncbi:PREDICTED: uncharacterized protein LOC104599146 [Nelumbo nucifera]|uniref:Uncharacterized protein LOC104599146 n=1 Tax=Nelumbo nucifera TaxID=4432 RepID=A0A1U7ZZ53_NELNU|nr:PREDICTED: uncharacterized protein LOC104599146 [Nelumbo nucifera]XP_010259847.1 PREDICTED: uncharacterized protein LOC104599146 [Nelumbo nucifera]XP_010259848.1 PREDICTED: uncharacterized protein LOC104599146 [Nelumbo nucifera]XP_010259850.1 PREDICTED: uncharacterized protein LOC104599146 [Nelumbo nucifera]
MSLNLKKTPTITVFKDSGEAEADTVSSGNGEGKSSFVSDGEAGVLSSGNQADPSLSAPGKEVTLSASGKQAEQPSSAPEEEATVLSSGNEKAPSPLASEGEATVSSSGNQIAPPYSGVGATMPCSGNQTVPPSTGSAGATVICSGNQRAPPTGSREEGTPLSSGGDQAAPSMGSGEVTLFPFGSQPMLPSSDSGEVIVFFSGDPTAPHSADSGGFVVFSPSSDQTAPPRRKRLPGTPDPDAEVIALSPETLSSTDQLVCEICKKEFSREQNLQLHRRGHDLPWKLGGGPKKEVRKQVFVCPEPSCIHHDPSRALGDLTGIKKHYLRKHCEKKFKCEKCSKPFAVRTDWKTHTKKCKAG